MKKLVTVLVLAGAELSAMTLAACGGPPAPRDAESAGAPSSEVAPAPSASDEAPSGELASIFAPKVEDTGLGITDLQPGEGASVQSGDKVKVTYVGKLADGTVFESSKDAQPVVEIVIGKASVLGALQRGIVGMKTGGIRRIAIPWSQGFGEGGRPPRIPAKADLVYDVELLDIPLPPGPTPPKPGDAPKNGGGRRGGGRRGR